MNHISEKGLNLGRWLIREKRRRQVDMRAWYWALIPSEMALGLLSTLMPLYVVLELNGSLIEVGEVVAAAAFSSIPASIFWGYLSDKMRRCKIVIAPSLLLLGLVFFLLAKAKSTYELLALSTVLGIFRSASPSVAGILIAELSPREEWRNEATKYRFALKLGEVAGLVVGTMLVVSYGYRGLLLLGGIFAFSSFALSLLLIQDPTWMFERKFMRLERMVNFAWQASFIISYGDGLKPSHVKKFTGRGPSATLFGFGVLVFSFAAQTVFTPLPVFFSQKVGMLPNLVFLVFLVSSLGSLFSYFFAEGWVENIGNENAVQISSLFRAFLFPSIGVCAYLSYTSSIIVGALVLAIIGVFWSLFAVSSSVLCMKIMPEGKMGFYTGLIELGSATGMIVGGALSVAYGFEPLFIVSGALFAASFIIFRLGLGSSETY